MDVEEFKDFAKASIDYLCDYLDNIRNTDVLSSVNPGYLKHEIPQSAPKHKEPWQEVLNDVDRIIMPGLTHWHSPNFHAYYPTASSYPSIVGELVLSSIGGIAKDWASNPAVIELEIRMMDWLCKILNLPDFLLNSSKGPGGGVIQNAASESTLVALISGKHRKLQEVKELTNLTEEEIKGKLVAYTSEQSNSSVEKAGLLGSVPMRLLPTDDDGSLRGETLLEAIKKDMSQGFIPCCVIATLGTTGTCAFDNLEELGAICNQENIWLHVDAAYAGTAFSCPEYRHLLKGVQFVDSFNFNLHKWMLVSADCSAMWFKNTRQVEDAFKIVKDIPEFEPQIEHWQIPNTRRFRALKIWFVLRTYGVEGIQKHVRQQIALAKYFGNLVKSDDRFEFCSQSMGLVCFRLNGPDWLTQSLLDKVTNRKKIFVIPYYYHKKLVIRFVICSRLTEKEDVDFAWKEITSQIEDSLPLEEMKTADFTNSSILTNDLRLKLTSTV